MGDEGKGGGRHLCLAYGRAFAPDGSLYVADEGYSVDANIQHFSRKGEFLGKIKAGKKSMGDKGIYKPQFLGVTETGKIVTWGSSEISEGSPGAYILTGRKLLDSWELERSVNQMALLPGEKIILSKTPAEDDNADTFEVYDLEESSREEASGDGFTRLPGMKKPTSAPTTSERTGREGSTSMTIPRTEYGSTTERGGFCRLSPSGGASHVDGDGRA
ncbi:hypothetical protein MASR2M79_24420 [Aminivibrio sp.]